MPSKAKVNAEPVFCGEDLVRAARGAYEYINWEGLPAVKSQHFLPPQVLDKSRGRGKGIGIQISVSIYRYDESLKKTVPLSGGLVSMANEILANKKSDKKAKVKNAK